MLNTNDLFRQLYADHRQELRQYVMTKFGLNPSESDDAVQITFMKFAKIADSLEDRSNLRAYLFRIAHNHVIDEKRTKYSSSKHISCTDSDFLDLQESDENSYMPDQTLNNPERIHSATQELTVMQRVIKTMPEQRQKYLKMSRFDNLSNVAIAKQEGITEAAVRKHVARALLDIKRALDTTAVEVG